MNREGRGGGHEQGGEENMNREGNEDMSREGRGGEGRGGGHEQGGEGRRT